MTRDQNACGLIQTRHTVPGSILYHSYWYRSGINRTMTENLHGIAQGAQDVVGLNQGTSSWTSGATTGRCWTATPPRTSPISAIDPSDVTRYAVEKGYEVIRDFFSAAPFMERFADRKAKVVT